MREFRQEIEEQRVASKQTSAKIGNNTKRIYIFFSVKVTQQEICIFRWPGVELRIPFYCVKSTTSHMTMRYCSSVFHSFLSFFFSAGLPCSIAFMWYHNACDKQVREPKVPSLPPFMNKVGLRESPNSASFSVVTGTLTQYISSLPQFMLPDP